MASSRDFIIGTLTGLTIGYLSAPQTGKKSREWLKKEYEKRTADSGSSSSGGSDWQEQLKMIFEKAKAEVMKYVDEKTGNTRKPTTSQFNYQRDRMEPRVAPVQPESLITPVSPTQMASPATGTIPSTGSYGV